MLVSVAFHAALFSSLLALHFSPSLTLTPPVLDVSLMHVDAGTAAHQQSPPAASPPATTAQTADSATQPRRTAPASDLPTPPADTQATPPPSSLDMPPPPQIRTVGTRAPSPSVDLAPLVANLAATVPRPQLAPVQPPAPKLAMSPSDHRMLNRRFTAFTEDFADVDGSRPRVSWNRRGQKYTATFTRVPAKNRMGIEQVIVDVSTKENGSRLSTRMRMKRLAFSSYAEFVDRWDPNVSIHDDHVDGRFHSNSDIYIEDGFGGRPSFQGKVTTAGEVQTSGPFGFPPTMTRNIFHGGLQTNVRPIVLPRHFVPFPHDSSPGKDRVQRFERSTLITFHANGTLSWKPLQSSAPEQRRTLPDAPFYITAAQGTELDIGGTVNGKVLVYSPAKIVIVGDLTYAVDPAHGAHSDDYLGLVSDEDVEIADEDTTGPGDLTVEAAIYARHRFVVDRFGRGHMATLSIYGSITAGSLSATEPRFRTKLHFDRRLENLRPPSFPMTSRYEVAAWDGKWTAEPTHAASPTASEPAPADTAGG